MEINRKIYNAKQTVDCGLVLKNKYGRDGRVDKRKAGLVWRRFSQRPGINLHDSYALVPKMSAIRIMIAFASMKNIKIYIKWME